MALDRAPQAIARRYHFARGKPLLCTPEFVDAMVEDVLDGMDPEAAAVHNGVSRQSYYRWMRDARGLEARAEEGEAVDLTDNDERVLALLHHVEIAEYEYMKTKLREINEVATPHRTRRSTVKEQLVREKGEIVYGADGRPLTVTLREVTETDEAEGRILLALLERRFAAFRQRITTEVSGPDGGPLAIEVTAYERRLVESIRPRLQAAQAPTEDIVEAEIVAEESTPAPTYRIPNADEDDDFLIVPNVLDDEGFSGFGFDATDHG